MTDRQRDWLRAGVLVALLQGACFAVLVRLSPDPQSLLFDVLFFVPFLPGLVILAPLIVIQGHTIPLWFAIAVPLASWFFYTLLFQWILAWRRHKAAKRAAQVPP
ncbi:MAG: hypothetical protein ACE5G6_06265 [Terriglobia bacterium]